jgi:hypothetical protein
MGDNDDLNPAKFRTLTFARYIRTTDVLAQSTMRHGHDEEENLAKVRRTSRDNRNQGTDSSGRRLLPMDAFPLDHDRESNKEEWQLTMNKDSILR